MKNEKETLRNYALPTLRIGLSLVFFWFGIKQLITPAWGLAWLPSWIQGIGIQGTTIIFINGIFEIIFATLLLLGLFTRLVASLLTLHLLGIILSVGYNEIGVRDFGLMAGTLAVALHGPDSLCLDKKIRKVIR